MCQSEYLHQLKNKNPQIRFYKNEILAQTTTKNVIHFINLTNLFNQTRLCEKSMKHTAKNLNQ